MGLRFLLISFFYSCFHLIDIVLNELFGIKLHFQRVIATEYYSRCLCVKKEMYIL